MVTRSPIWLSPSGQSFQGVNANDVPLWDPLTLEWVAGAVPTAPDTPLTTVRYVDAGTTVPLADQNGSATAPFALIQDAINSFPNPTVNGVLLIAPADYTAEAPAVPGTIAVIQFVALGNKVLTTLPVLLGSVTCADGCIGVALDGCRAATVNVDSTTALVQVALRQCALTGNLLDLAAAPNGFSANLGDNTTIAGDVGTLAAPVTLLESSSDEIATNIGGDVFLGAFGFASFVGGGFVGTLLGTGNGSVVLEGAQCGALDAIGGLVVRDSEVGGIIGATTPIGTLNGFDTRFTGDVHLANVAGHRLEDCIPLAQWTCATDIEMDAWTRYRFDVTGLGLLGGGTFVVTERANQETQTVALGNQLPGDLAFYDVPMTAELQGVDVGDLVTVQPAADITAAGAGAGFLAYAYVSGPGTVRIAVVGTVAAGNYDFNFAQCQ